jgi:hypothetical protein
VRELANEASAAPKLDVMTIYQTLRSPGRFGVIRANDRFVQKARYSDEQISSAVAPKPDMQRLPRHVRKLPSADLLNHLVGDSPDQTRLLMFSVTDRIRWR